MEKIFVLLLTLFCCQSLFAQNEETIVANTFSLKPFQSKITEKSLISIFKCVPNRSRELVKRNQGIVADSVITLKFDDDHFFFLKKAETSTFYGAKIVDARITLSQNVYVGISKSDFLKIFNKTNMKSDVIIITDENEMCYHYFTFRNFKLVEIKIDGCLD